MWARLNACVISLGDRDNKAAVSELEQLDWTQGLIQISQMRSRLHDNYSNRQLHYHTKKMYLDGGAPL